MILHTLRKQRGLKGVENNATRPLGFNANGLFFDGSSNWLNLDLNSTGFLENSFEGRTVSFRFKPNEKVYAGPTVTKYSDLVAYFPFDESSGAVASDLSVNSITGNISGSASWAGGNYNNAISLDGVDDSISLETQGVLKELHKKSYTVSLWVNPANAAPGKYTPGQLNSYGFTLPMSEVYFSSTDILFSLNPSGTNLLTDGPTGNGLSFLNDDHFKNAGIGINQNDNYLSLFTGVFRAKEEGTYTWETRGNDNRGVMWIDLNQNGAFEVSGSLGNERVLDAAYPNNESKNVVLSEGYYPIALVHGEATGGSSLELYFSTPSANAGPTSLTLVNPSANPDLFLTENSSSIIKRGPFSLKMDGNNTLSFTHSTTSQSVSVYSSVPISSSNWTHVAAVLDYNASSLKLFQSGALVDSIALPDDASLNLLATETWEVGGTSRITRDYFNGLVDDLRFYNSALSDVEINATYNDDISSLFRQVT
jgi:hypothetical protein